MHVVGKLAWPAVLGYPWWSGVSGRKDGSMAMTGGPVPQESHSHEPMGMAGIEAFGLFPFRIGSVRIAKV